MIIRITVKDNDFGEILEDFVRNLSNRMTRVPDNIENMQPKEQIAFIRSLNKIERLLNPNVTEQLTEDEKSLICGRVKEVFGEYVYSLKELSIYTIVYLVTNFSVEITNSMEDKWENGEVVYWFQHSGVWLNQ